MTQALQSYAKGFTKSYRKKWFNPVFRNLLEAGIWSWMCDTAVWEQERVMPFNGVSVTLKRGELIFSERFVSEAFCYGRQSIRTFLANLQLTHMITRKSTNKASIVFICNYELYQHSETEEKPTPNPHANQQLTQKQRKEEYNNNSDDCNARKAEKNLIEEIHGWIVNRLSSPSFFYPLAPIAGWLKWGADFDLDIKPSVERYLARSKGAPRSLQWLDEYVASSIQQRKKPMPEVRAGHGPPAKPRSFYDTDFDQRKVINEVFGNAGEPG